MTIVDNNKNLSFTANIWYVTWKLRLWMLTTQIRGGHSVVSLVETTYAEWPPSDDLITQIFLSFFVSEDSLQQLTSQRRLLIHHANAKDNLIYIMSKTGEGEWTSDWVKMRERKQKQRDGGRNQAGNEVPTTSGWELKWSNRSVRLLDCG